MTNAEAKKFLTAKLECLERERCNIDCDECELLYAAGNMGEQKEALRVAIKSLEQEPKTGYWVVESTYDWGFTSSVNCYCSNCKDYFTRQWKEMNFCPNCGAKMESEGKE